jgi:hypothetical protein
MPLSSLEQYHHLQGTTSRAKRRCKVCQRKASYYCVTCSDREQNQIITLCSLTKRDQDTNATSCYFIYHNPHEADVGPTSNHASDADVIRVEVPRVFDNNSLNTPMDNRDYDYPLAQAGETQVSALGTSPFSTILLWVLYRSIISFCLSARSTSISTCTVLRTGPSDTVNFATRKRRTTVLHAPNQSKIFMLRCATLSTGRVI